MRRIAALLVLLVFGGNARALSPNEWKFSQACDVSGNGLMRINLPPETLNEARPEFEDLRIIDGSGQEVPYLINRWSPKIDRPLRPQELKTELQSAATRITLTTGTKHSLQGVMLETPADFIKGVQVEGSHDGNNWHQLAAGQPIFKMAQGATNLRVGFPEGIWEFLRLTIDDSRSAAVPFTGVRLEMAETNAQVAPVSATIKSHDDSAGVTRLTLDLGAVNLTLAVLHLEASDRLFTRQVRIVVPQIDNGAIREQTIGTGSIYKMDLNGKVESRLEISINQPIHARQLIVLIDNGDSPPLDITSVHCDRHLDRLVFLANQPGRYRLLSGNRECPAPRYDLSQLGDQLKSAQAMDVRLGPLVATPDYKMADGLATLPLGGAKFDLTGWKFRRPIEVSKAGAQEIELDPDVLSHSEFDLRDLRVVSEDRQMPYLLERTSIARSIALGAATANDSKDPKLSRWSLKLPGSAVPIMRVACATGSMLFQRQVRLWEEVTDERGDKYPHELGRATWQRVPNQETREYVIELTSPPRSDTLFLEAENGDNPAIELHGFRASYPATRIVFEVAANNARGIWLYYGNSDAMPPRYDVSLIADQLLRAERVPAKLGNSEKTGSATEQLVAGLTGSSRYIFWGILGIVVIALLVLISRLLPKEQ